MSTLNWKIFGLKYDQKETSAFEDLSYLLFCAELENRIGLFRYKNQAGLETEPITKNGIEYGFQAKFYSTPVRDNKADIIDSIQKAKRENSAIDKLLFYINQEFSESTKKGQKKPQYQLDIESEAEKVKVEIDWRVPSHFELQLLLPQNKYIHDLFFCLEPSGGNLVDDIKRHTENIFQSIQTEIVFNTQSIKIKRIDVIEQIKQSVENNHHLIISGEGGCGKTAVVKDYYSEYSKVYPICIFKATELNIRNINDLFRIAHDFSFEQFIDAYKSEAKKLFVIDSSEKLAEINNSDILQNLINSLQKNNWTIVFTTRYCYLDDLQFHIKQTYHFPFEVTHISQLTPDSLLDLSNTFTFKLPDNYKFKDRLKNLFYLNEYLQEYATIDKCGNFKTFVDLIWKKRIQNIACKKDNIHIERERSFLKIAIDRCNTALFYINAIELPQQAIFQLQQDEILGYEEAHDGYFITHDIYEEWALDKIISRAFANYIDVISFYAEIGESLPMRRAFRYWLSEEISEDNENIKGFIEESFNNNEISQFWKDELLVSILLSEYSSIFFLQFEQEIKANDFVVLDRILFLLRIACTEIIENKNLDSIDFIFTQPKGKGWEAAIEFVNKYREEYFDNHLKLVLPILTDWVEANKIGNTTKLAGLLALSIIEKKAIAESFYIEDKTESIILKIIYNGSNEIKDTLSHIFDKVVDNKWVHNNEPYEELCTKILEEPYSAIEIIKVLPIYVIKLCDLFWQHRNEKNGMYHRNDMEEKYGLVNEYKFNYFPASALQTPVYFLLRHSFYETLDFIIDFTNRSIEHYRHSDYGKEDIEEVILQIDDKEITQFLSWALWGMYRGVGSPVVPYLLQSIHMALEKVLLEYADSTDSKIIENVLLMILIKSKSASLTAIVCSVVLANPEKFINVALVLFKTIELFHIDSQRCMNESMTLAPSLPNKEFHSKERLQTKNDKHRKLNLESLLMNYQLIGTKGLSEEENATLIKSIYSIIDVHKVAIQSKPKDEQLTYGILLARMDRRTMHPKVTKQDDLNYIIDLNPDLAPELKEHSEQAMKQFEDFMKYSSVKMWSIFKNEGNAKAIEYPQYETNPQSALNEARAILTEMRAETNHLFPTDDYIPSFVCSALIRFYHKELSPDELIFCKEVVLGRICDIFNDSYNYQVSDGVEVAIHSIPQLMQLFPDEVHLYKRLLLFGLFDVSKVGNKRICDYVIESIHQRDLWSLAFEDAKSLLYAYIHIKPLFDKYFKEELPRSDYQFGQRRTSKENVLEKVEAEIKNIEFNNISIQLSDLNSFSINDIGIIFQLIPDATHSIELTSIVKRLLPSISSLLIINDRHGESHLYLLRIYMFKKFAQFVLNRQVDELGEYMNPFLEKLSANDETLKFVGAFVAAEWDFVKYEQFWAIWKILYNPILKRCTYGYHSNEVIIEYMLAWPWWGNETEWHTLKEQNLSFYRGLAKDLGNNPAVLYSITKVLNSIGSHFVDDGINWIYIVVSENKDLILKDLESNTIIYLERLMRKFIFKNKDRIKHEIKLKKQIVQILEFIIERGSVHGYLLRESIL